MTVDPAGAAAPSPGHRREPHTGSLTARLNWLRAGVLGANDGIISTAGLVIGVAAATTDTTEIAVAGLAGLTAGAVSMALGEYVSVSSQRDTEQALIAKERRELQEMPAAEHNELVGLLVQHFVGLSARRRHVVERPLQDGPAFPDVWLAGEEAEEPEEGVVEEVPGG